MSFTDHKITAFAHKIADLADQPTLPPDELKSRFDACPEELRQSLNAVCDDAARLEARVEGIVVDTFGDTIDKEMLSDELAAELDAKAVEASVASRIAAEQAAREAADTAETAAREALAATVAQKCEVYFGTYTGNDALSRTIDLGVTPQAVLIVRSDGAMQSSQACYGGLALTGAPVVHGGTTMIAIVDDGFQLTRGYLNSGSYWSDANSSNFSYYYLAMV